MANLNGPSLKSDNSGTILEIVASGNIMKLLSELKNLIALIYASADFLTFFSINYKVNGFKPNAL
jgi:hypothetical protein